MSEYALLSVPAGGAVAWYDLTVPSIETVVGLQSTGALTGLAVHCAVARVTQTLRLSTPGVHHAARKLIARQEFTGVRLVGWEEEKQCIGGVMNVNAVCTYLPVSAGWAQGWEIDVRRGAGLKQGVFNEVT